MKFFHYSAGTVSRSSGRSCVQAVAYITRSLLFEERRGIDANYTYAKSHDVSWETLSPEGSGIGKEDLSIWNKADLSEDQILAKRYKDPELRDKKINSARTAYDDEFSLPKELTREQNTELVREYITTKFISKGLVATYAIHWEEGNPHVHIVYSTRPFKDGKFSECKSVSRSLRGPGGVRGLREDAAHTINTHQELAGLEDRVDPRSYAERGIDLIPTRHKGWMAHQLERDGLYSRMATGNQEISQENKEKVAAFPGIILKELTSTQATFSESDVVRLMQQRLKDDIGILGEHVLHAVMKEAVKVGKDINENTRYTSQEYYGKEAKILESFDRYQAKQTTIKIDPEKVGELIGNLQEQSKETGIVPNAGQVNSIRTLCGDSQLSVMIGRAGTGKTTTLKSVVKLHEDAGFTVIGMAPSATAATQLEADTGCASDTISHYAYYWKKYDQALDLLHAATTGKEREAAQKVVDKYAAYLPNSNTLIIVDEAGMVGVGDHKGAIPGGWDAITRAVTRTGAKLILTGDDHQFKPIEAGDVFRRLIYGLKMDVGDRPSAGDRPSIGGRTPAQFCELTEIIRQRTPWMEEASSHLAELNVATALGMYEHHGHIKEHSLNADAYKDMAKQYFHNITSKPGSKGTVIAATNEERLALNREIRSILKENGLLPKEDLLQTGNAEGRLPAGVRLPAEGRPPAGVRSLTEGQAQDGYTVGDQIVFTKNDRGWNTEFEVKGARKGKSSFFVQNNMKAVIQSITPIRIKDQETGEVTDTHEIVAYVPDHKATIKFNLENFKEFAHGYAVTGWKSQGNTLDWVIAKLSKYMDAYGLYVILTRHRDDISLHYSTEDFPDYKALVHSLSRANVKDLVVDYSVADEHKEYWENVQDYKETGRELQGIRALIRGLEGDGKENKEEINDLWETHRVVKEDRKGWAKHILGDWEVHKDFVRQAALTKESLEIAAGLKKLPLTRVEIEAQGTVEQYVSVSLETRQLWRNIRRTHPGTRARSHPEWPKFEEARDQRGTLANQICLNPILHRPFLKETAESLEKAGIGYVTKDNRISYSMATIKAQAEAHQSKILQKELLKGDTDPAQKAMLKILIAYIEARDHFGQMWQETRPKLAALKGSLLEGSLEKELSGCMEMGMTRDGYAVKIVEKQEGFEALASKVGIKLNVDRLAEEAARGRLNDLIKTYSSSPELMAKLEAASGINALMKGEAELEKKPMISQVFRQGIQPRDIARDALEYQKVKLFESLKPGPERDLFLLLDEYDAKCRKANQLYSLCIGDTEGKGKKPWESPHYPAYKGACNSRNGLTLEIFDQRDHNQVLAMAEAMGIRFKDVDLAEIFSRCEQAARTNHIMAYKNARGAEVKGQAAVSIRQMIEFERRDTRSPSKTAQQAFHSGIDFKELQTVAFDYGRSCVLKGLGSQKEIEVYQALEAYENALRPANRSYKECIAEARPPDESKENTTKAIEVKPWETEKFKEYISLVTIQDEKAYGLIKGYDAHTVTKIAKQMGISVKKLDVEAHRHSLRQTLQTFMDGDRTNVPMAAREVLNWLEFDRHSDHKHTFKIVREQDLWPNDIQEGLQAFFEKNREWRHETQRDLKDAAKAVTQAQNSFKPEYKIITYERRQTFKELNQQLTERIYELATHILGKPTSKNRDSIRFGKNGSICVFTSGKRQGIYTNFETDGKGKGPLGMIEEQMGLSTRDAFEWASEWLGGNPLIIEQHVVQKHQKERQLPTWTPITPVPDYAPQNPDITNEYLNYLLKNGNKEVARYAYRDEQGRLKGYILRLERPDPEDLGGKNLKEIRHLAFCRNERGKEYWLSKGFFEAEKTAYGLEKLAQDPAKPVLVVEGEKTADAAQKMLPGYHVLSWVGGAGNVGNTNWECLAGREVAIWPDNDAGGIKAAEILKKIVTSLNTEKDLPGTVEVVPLPETLPDKWDLADKLPEGWVVDTVKEMIRETVPCKDKAVVISHEHEDAIKDGAHGNYTSQEEQILDYLRQELTAEKTPWLDGADFERFLKSAEENPVHTLQRWQKITDDYSFKFTTDKPADLNDHQKEATKLQEAEILAYLHNEVRADKHEWLSTDYAEGILNAAKDDPFATLDRWKDLSGDNSFEPSIPEALMNEGQKTIKNSILSYLKENMQRTNKEDIDEKTHQKIINLAGNNPDKGLQEWQLLTENYQFNPYTHVMGKRELKVNEYLKGELVLQGGELSQNVKKEITAYLHSDPLKAYGLWHLYTNDKTFDPKTGIPAIETQAQMLVDSIKTHVPGDLLESWQGQMTRNPGAVLKECQEFIQFRDVQDIFHKSVKEFIQLSESYEKLSWKDPQRDKIEQGLKKITDRYLSDEEFKEKVEGSKSQAASERLADEIRERDRTLSQNMGGRGPEM